MKNTKGFLNKITMLLGTASLLVATLVVVALPNISLADTLNRQLELGMSGSDVGTLQTFLAQDSTIYPQGLITSYFGSLTKSAVSNFQAVNNLPNVGRVGPMTLQVINARMNNGNTTGGDRQASTISQINTSTSSNNATVSWSTNENTSAVVYYSTSPLAMVESSANAGVTIYGTSVIANSDLRLSHTATLSNLQSHTMYYYVVYVKDASGNETISGPYTLQTAN